MTVKGWAVTAGIGAAAGAVAVLMIPFPVNWMIWAENKGGACPLYIRKCAVRMFILDFLRKCVVGSTI